MELRPAELEDLESCALLSATVQSGYVWQLSLTREPAVPAMASEFSMSLRCLRLPRPVRIMPAGAALDDIWKRADAAFVADDNGAVSGFIILTYAEERSAANIARIVVAPAARRSGIGTGLLRTAGRWATGEGLECLIAHCAARNHPGVAFYLNSGFTFAGYSESYYPRGDVALLWQRSL